MPARAAVLIGIALIGGYTAVWRVNGLEVGQAGFFVTLGVPLLYVSLMGVGAAVRSVNREQLDVLGALAASRAAAASADERARLAREMHDSLAKTLHGVAMMAAALPHWVGNDPDRAAQQARLLADGAERAAEEARTLLKRLRADQPDRPLAEILGGLCRDWSAVHSTPCEFQASGVVDVSTEVRYELVSIAGECLENVARHAGARAVTMTLRRSGELLELDVTDDGRGVHVDLDQLVQEGHYGVRGMTERAAEVGGTLQLVRPPNGGTSVRLAMPYESSVVPS
jgi:signal transduction histidine kinase